MLQPKTARRIMLVALLISLIIMAIDLAISLTECCIFYIVGYATLLFRIFGVYCITIAIHSCAYIFIILLLANLDKDMTDMYNAYTCLIPCAIVVVLSLHLLCVFPGNSAGERAFRVGIHALMGIISVIIFFWVICFFIQFDPIKCILEMFWMLLWLFILLTPYFTSDTQAIALARAECEEMARSSKQCRKILAQSKSQKAARIAARNELRRCKAQLEEENMRLALAKERAQRAGKMGTRSSTRSMDEEQKSSCECMKNINDDDGARYKTKASERKSRKIDDHGSSVDRNSSPRRKKSALEEDEEYPTESRKNQKYPNAYENNNELVDCNKMREHRQSPDRHSSSPEGRRHLYRSSDDDDELPSTSQKQSGGRREKERSSRGCSCSRGGFEDPNKFEASSNETRKNADYDCGSSRGFGGDDRDQISRKCIEMNIKEQKICTDYDVRDSRSIGSDDRDQKPKKSIETKPKESKKSADYDSKGTRGFGGDDRNQKPKKYFETKPKESKKIVEYDKKSSPGTRGETEFYEREQKRRQSIEKKPKNSACYDGDEFLDKKSRKSRELKPKATKLKDAKGREALTCIEDENDLYEDDRYEKCPKKPKEKKMYAGSEDECIDCVTDQQILQFATTRRSKSQAPEPRASASNESTRPRSHSPDRERGYKKQHR